MDKDYYKILAITHNANEQEIKKAYRHLAMKFHPDRNEGDQLAENNFREVQEAYDILSHPGRRSAYNQQRWYRSTSHKKQDSQAVSAYGILHKCKALNRYIETLDSFHINRRALNNYILQLLSESNLEVLTKENDHTSNDLIIKELLKSSNPLPFISVKKIGAILTILAGDNSDTVKTIRQYVTNKKMSDYLDQYLPLIVLLVAILLCFFIYFTGNAGS